jgi:hypothetical protein
MSNSMRTASTGISRRQWLHGAVAATAAGALDHRGLARGADQPAATKGRIQQSLVEWCYTPYWKLDELCQVAGRLGCKSVELVQPESWPILKKHGMKCAISPSHLFVQGMNNPRYQPGCLEMLKKRIDQAADFGVPTVITFTGYAEDSGDWADGTVPDLSKLPAGRHKIDRSKARRTAWQASSKSSATRKRRGSIWPSRCSTAA